MSCLCIGTYIHGACVLSFYQFPQKRNGCTIVNAQYYIFVMRLGIDSRYTTNTLFYGKLNRNYYYYYL